MGTQIELAQKIGCQVSHINSLLKGSAKSARGYLKTLGDSQVRVLNDIKVIRHNSFGERRGSIKELASSIGASESHVGMLFNLGARRVKTVKGWYNPELNPDGEGGYGSGALKNRWWQNIKKQSSGSLTVWRDVKLIYVAWLKSDTPGYHRFSQILADMGYTISRKRVENLIKLFKDTEQYSEMLQAHSETDFDSIIRQKEG